MLGLFQVFIILFYVLIFGSILWLIYRWVSKFIKLREEQNRLLEELIKRLDNKL